MLRHEAGRLHGELDRGPQQIEIDEMHDFAIEISAPVAVDHLRQEQAGDQKKVRHSKGLGEGNHRMQPAVLPHRLSDAQRRMHHDDEDDAKSLGIVDPVHALACRDIVGGLHARDSGFHREV